MILISQDGLKAIDADKVAFYYIPRKTENDSDGIKFSLYAKSPLLNGDFYDLIRLFRHKDLSVVKHVMRFLVGDTNTVSFKSSYDILVVDLPNLYMHGMKKIAPAETLHDQRAGD